MNPLIEAFWKRQCRSAPGRFFAGLFIGGTLGVSASFSVSHDLHTAIICTVISALIGGTAAILLETRDKQRAITPKWQQRVEKTANKIRTAYPEVPPPLATKLATTHEEKRFTPMVWFGLVLGAFSAVCCVVAAIFKIIELFR